MDIIKELADVLTTHDLTHLEYESEGVKVVLKREHPESVAFAGNLAAAVAEGLQAGDAAGLSAAGTDCATNNNTSGGAAGSGKPDGSLITAPMIGKVYRAPDATSPPFVNVGQQVHVGDILCLIEAMKVFNEITASEEGTILDIHFEEGVLVEYGTPLFTLG